MDLFFSVLSGCQYYNLFENHASILDPDFRAFQTGCKYINIFSLPNFNFYIGLNYAKTLSFNSFLKSAFKFTST